MKGEFVGVVSKPRRETYTYQRDGETIEKQRMRLTLYCPILSAKKVDGQRPKQKVFVTLADKYDEKIFKYIRPGRHIRVYGDLSCGLGESNGKHYANLYVIATDILFLDTKPIIAAERVIKTLKQLNLVNEDEETLIEGLRNYYNGNDVQEKNIPADPPVDPDEMDIP